MPASNEPISKVVDNVSVSGALPEPYITQNWQTFGLMYSHRLHRTPQSLNIDALATDATMLDSNSPSLLHAQFPRASTNLRSASIDSPATGVLPTPELSDDDATKLLRNEIPQIVDRSQRRASIEPQGISRLIQNQSHHSQSNQPMNSPQTLLFPVGPQLNSQDLEESMQRFHDFRVNNVGESHDSKVRYHMDNILCALGRNDLLFLMVHQIWCLWALKPTDVPRLLRNHPEVRSCMAIFDAVFDFAITKTTSFQDFFSTFPHPIADTMSETPKHATVFQYLPSLFHILNRNFPPLKDHCCRQNRPPFPAEIMNPGRLDLRSPALRNAVFWHLAWTAWRDVSRNAFTDLYHLIHASNGTHNCISLEMSFRQIYDKWRIKTPAESMQMNVSSVTNNQEQHLPTFQHQTQASTEHMVRWNAGPPQQDSTQGYGRSVQLSGPQIRASNHRLQSVAQTQNDILNSASYPHADTRQQRSMHAQSPYALSSGQGSPALVRSISSNTFQTPTHFHQNLSNPTRFVMQTQSGISSTIDNTGMFVPRGNTARPMPAKNTAIPSQKAWRTQKVFLPYETKPVSFAIPDPTNTAIHLARLRTPELQVVQTSTLNKASWNPFKQFYQYPSGLLLDSHELQTPTDSISISFHVGKEHISATAKESISVNTGSIVKFIDQGSLSFRLRCVSTKDPVLESSQWFQADTCWPRHVEFKFNGSLLEKRRKLHFGRDLPIDITQHLHQGENTIKVIFTTRKKLEAFYSIAVEVVRVDSLTTIKNNIMSCIVSAQEVQRQLKSRSMHSNDEVAIVNENIFRISMQDPLTRRICQIPVRGRNCLHFECFDLDAFLQGRPFKSVNGASEADCWKCPICAGDVRPCEIVVDGWMTEISDNLRKNNLLDVVAILVDMNHGCQWIPAPKEERSNNPVGGYYLHNGTKHEVIEIDDD